MLVVPAPGRQRQEDLCELKGGLVYRDPGQPGLHSEALCVCAYTHVPGSEDNLQLAGVISLLPGGSWRIDTQVSRPGGKALAL